MSGERKMESLQGGPKGAGGGVHSFERVETKAGRRKARLTAICPLSSVRYALTSSRATTAHCLP